MAELKYTFCTLIIFLGVTCNMSATSSLVKSTEEKHILVTMRLVGDKVLHTVGDPDSRVLPIEREGNYYKIPFEAPFGFDPDTLAVIIDSVMTLSGVSSHYLVETTQCNTGIVMHSFEVGPAMDIVPCKGRKLPDDCYYISITLLDVGNGAKTLMDIADDENSSLWKSYFLFIPIFLMVGLIGYYVKKNNNLDLDRNMITLGQSQFDSKNMVLYFKDKKIDLSNKETELLSLLLKFVNTPVEREILLEKIWGDEGDYVGRTLDVFISKLRKKLEADTQVRIMNIRGVGYKLVVN